MCKIIWLSARVFIARLLTHKCKQLNKEQKHDSTKCTRVRITATTFVIALIISEAVPYT